MLFVVRARRHAVAGSAVVLLLVYVVRAMETTDGSLVGLEHWAWVTASHA